MEKIYILLPVYNRRNITERFIKCLKSQTFKNYHLVVIDDGSVDKTEEMVCKEISSVTVIKGNGNWWWAGSLQQGYKWLKMNYTYLHDIVLIINDDTEFEHDFLEKAILLVRRNKKILLLAQCYCRQTNKLIDAGLHINWKMLSFEQADDIHNINCLSTRGLFLRINDLFEIRGFYPKLLPHYASDYEFTIRADKKGFKLITDKSLKLWSDETTTGYHSFNDTNIFVFFKKYFSLKSAANPFIWSIFIALACPWRWKFINWFRVWKRLIYKLVYFSKG